MNESDEGFATNPDAQFDTSEGLHRGLAHYGDRAFSLFLRKAFIKGAGFTDDALNRPVMGSSTQRAALIPAMAMPRS